MHEPLAQLDPSPMQCEPMSPPSEKGQVQSTVRVVSVMFGFGSVWCGCVMVEAKVITCLVDLRCVVVVDILTHEIWAEESLDCFLCTFCVFRFGGKTSYPHGVGVLEDTRYSVGLTAGIVFIDNLMI